MKALNKYVGLDVHKDTTVIAVAEGGREGKSEGGQVAWRLKRNSKISVSLWAHADCDKMSG